MARLYPAFPSRVGKKGRIKTPGGRILSFVVEDEVRVTQTKLNSKILILEKVRFEDERVELRLGYFIIGKKGRTRGRWVWGQFATLMPIKDFQRLIRKAERAGWF